MKRLLTAILFSLLFSLTTISIFACKNIFDDDVQSEETQEYNSEDKDSEQIPVVNQPSTPQTAQPRIIPPVKFTGLIFNEGANPDEIEQIMATVQAELELQNSEADGSDTGSVSGSDRSASPSVPLANTALYTYSYFAYYQDYSDPLNPGPVSNDVEVTLSNGNRVFLMSLETGHTWKVTTGLKQVSNDASPVTKILLSDSFTLTPTEENPLLSHAFLVKPSTGGQGNIDLKINLDATNPIDHIDIVYDEESGNPVPSLPFSAVRDSAISNQYNIQASNITSGQYKVRILFKDANGFQKYSSIQTINVYDNLLTNKWEGVPLAEGSGGSGTTDSQKFKVTNTAIAQAAQTMFYVGTTVMGTAGTNGNGSPAAPFNTLQRAVDLIAANGESSKAYTLFVSGSVSGTADFSTALNGHAQSILIQGTSGSSSDSLENASGTVASVETSVPVTFEKIKVSCPAGVTGISVAGTSSSVILGSDSLVSSSDSGYGVSVTGGSFTMRGSAKVSGTNGVYLANGKTITVPDENLTGGTLVAKITLEEFRRRVPYINSEGGSTVLNAVMSKFVFSDDEEEADWAKSVSGNQLIINSPVYVAGTAASDPSRVFCGAGRTAAEGALGTRSRPFSTIAEALSVFEDSTSAANITVDGEVNGAQTIGGTGVTINASEIRIYKIHVAGVGGSGKLNGGFNASNTGSVLTIDTSILVTLSGLEITGGYSTANGGGINIINSSAKVTLDNVKIQGNYAAANGGGIYIPAGAKVAGYGDNFIIGKEDATGPAGSGTELSTGINKAANGGGIYNAGIFRLGGIVDSSGSIGGVDGNCGVYANVATGSTDDTGNGGGIYVASTGVIQFAHGSVKYNYASTSGGAVYNLGSTVLWGDTVLYDSTNAEKTNDIYLSGNTKLSVQSDQSSVNGTNPVATITPSAWTRGKEVLDSASSSTTTLTNSYSKIKVSDSDWNVGYYVSGTATADLASRIGADIWVAGTYDGAELSGDVGNNVTGGKVPSNSNHGTKKEPYADIATAVAACWSTSRDFTINIDGTVGGAQTIGGTISAGSITIKGYKAADATSSTAKINAGGASGTGSALTVNASGKTVTIQDLTITGGNAENGGGINLAAGTVKLTDGVTVTGNLASSKGGGVYVDSTAKLLMYGTAWIGDSSENQATSNTLTSSGSDTGCANTAYFGGGIYNYGGIVALGYDVYTDATSNSPKDFTGGVGRNYAGLFGGGIYGKFIISGGSVSYNNSYQGGGLYIPQNVTDAKITGGIITYNSAQIDGGAAYINTNAKLSMSGNAEISNNSASRGGGIFTSTGTFEMSGGSFASNTATGAGGAIYQDGDFIMSGSALITSGSEKSNDVYLPSNNSITVASTTLNGGTTVAAITPDSFSRGRPILYVSSSITLTEEQLNTIKGKIALTEDGWNKENIIISTVYAGVKINSPIYVASTAASDSTRKVCSPGVTSGAKGTSAKPYATIAAALGASDLAVAGNKITIDGTIGKQEIAPSASLSAVTIAGYKAGSDTTSSAKIDAGGTTGAGSALTVNKSGLTVTITDLTITGGSGSSMMVGGVAQTNGGGILLNAGTVKLSDGAVITGNAVANNGGGVYLSASGCALYMSGKALIGDSATSTTRATSAANNRANQAANGAGIYNNGGSVFIGSNTSGTAASGYSLVNDDTNGHYGVRRNYSTTSGAGAGIYHAGGTLKIASGDVSLNNAGGAGAGACNGGGVYCAADVDISGGTFKNNFAANGGGLYIATGKKATVNGAAVFTQNQSWVNGGAVYNAGEFTMSAGTIGGSNSSDANLAAGSAGLASYGGAIYQGGTFNISGSAYVYPGSVKSNDVYLPSEKVVTINSNYTGDGNNGTDKMALTPAVLKRGSSVLGGASCSTTNAGYFMITDSEWSILSESAYKGKLDAQLWVAGTSNTANGVGTPDTGANGALGTKSKPYSTISEAVNQCWDSNRAFTIYLSGTITGETQTIPAANSTAKTGLASSITIEGFTGNTSDVIDRNLSSVPASGGSALTISTATPVTIKKIKITKGYSAGNGGGINVDGVKGASLTLGEGALITANIAYSNGGGIYIGGTSTGNANLIMNSTATVSANNASLGGGIYLSYANLCMSGSALIGDTGVTSISVGGDYASNSATYGGGVYCVTGSNIYLGCNTSGETSSGGVSYVLDSDCGIRHNYASASGGGVDLHAGSMTIKSGSVSYNSTHYNWSGDRNGGGIWQISGSTITMSGGTIAKNQALNGGGVYAGGSFTMTGGTIGDSSGSITSPAENHANCSNYANSYGGGIYAPSGASVSISGGYINYNYATYGGGIYWEGSTLSVTDGNISYNRGNYGGGIHFESGATLTKATFTKNDASSGGALNIASGREVTVSGAAAFTGNTASNGGAVYNYGTFMLTGGATFTSNSASTSGGAVYNDGAFTMSAGTIGGSSGQNTAGSYGNGGAVWCDSDSTFTMSGSASIPYGGSVKSNDIYLYFSSIGLGNTLSNHSTSSQVGVTLPSGFPTGNAVLTGGTDSDAYAYTKLHYKKFKLTSDGYYIDSAGIYKEGYLVTSVSDAVTAINSITSGTKTIAIEGTVTSVTDLNNAIKSCSGKVNLDLSGASGLSEIPSQAFKDNTKLEFIVLPDGVTTIGESAFNGCSGLKGDIYLTHVTSIGISAFYRALSGGARIILSTTGETFQKYDSGNNAQGTYIIVALDNSTYASYSNYRLERQ